jgi:uncharacterized protein YbbC (DUF1343 family)
MSPLVRSGLDVWAAQGFSALKGLRVGAIVNPTSVDSRFNHLADLLMAAEGVTLSALFGPEHGIRGEAQYMVAVDDVARDRKTGVPVYSLYGHTFESLTPKPDWLRGLDALVFDIQDVGSRYYTYVYTMALAMKAAAQAKLVFYVLDRPNPIGLAQVEGNLVQERFKSFVGLYALPNRHGMTAGELARLFNTEEKIGCELHVVACEGLSRATRWHEMGRHFVPPSPNMPTVDTALVYPGMCFGEGTNVSEGRGTCRPFEQFGAPWLDGAEVAATLNGLQLPGVCFRPVAFTPTFDKHKGVSCEGAFIHVTDREAFLPWRTGVAIFRTVKGLRPKEFQWRSDAYEFVREIHAFDLLAGTDSIRAGIEAGASLEALTAGAEAEAGAFQVKRERYLLYS